MASAFVQRLFTVLTDERHARWCKYGDHDAICLIDVGEIASYCAHCRSSTDPETKRKSFIRQLHYYGFKRIRDVGQAVIFWHPQFERSGKTLAEIKRTTAAARNTEQKVDRLDETMEQNQKVLTQELLTIRAQNEALHRQVQSLAHVQRKIQETLAQLIAALVNP